MQTIQNQQKDRYSKLFFVLNSVWTVFVGVLFIIQVWRIFLSSATSPYTTESITKHFNQIAPFVYVWIVLTLINGVVFQTPKQKIIPQQDAKKTACRLRARLQTQDGQDLNQKYRFRTTYTIVGAVLCLIIVIFSAILLFNKNYQGFLTSSFFSSHKEAEKLILIFGSFILLGIVCYILSNFIQKSYEEETLLLKDILVEYKKAGVSIQKQETKATPSLRKKLFDNVWFLRSVRIALFLFAITFILIGIDNGGMADVLEKAINICTQCIGLG